MRKVLRIGIVQGGRIVEERLLRRRDTVTVGQSPKNKFVIPSSRIPLSYTLVEVKSGQYHLCFEKGMFGKVLIDGDVLDLKNVARRKLAKRKDNRFYLPLSEETRGKIVLGDVTLLFQFVAPPPEVPKLQLPASAKGAWWRNIDKTFALILVFSLFSQGGFEGYQEYYWRSTGRFLIQERKGTPKILQTLVRIEKQDEEEIEPEDEGLDKEAKEPEFKDQAEGIKETAELAEKVLESTDGEKDLASEAMSDGLELADPMEGAGDPGMGDVKDDLRAGFEEQFKDRTPARSAAAQLASADRMVSDRTVVGVLGSEFGHGDGGVDVLSGGARAGADSGTWGEGDITVGGDFGGPKSDIFAGGDDSIGALLEAGNGAGLGAGLGVGPGIGAQLDLGLRAEVARDVEIAAPARKLEVVKKDEVVSTEKQIKVSVRGGRISGVVGGKIDRAAVEKYLRQRTVAVQRCYYDVVRRNPNAGGRLVLEMTIATNGRADVKVVSDSVGDSGVASCVTQKIKSWRFPKPEEKSVRLKVPFVFRSL
ncbi:MAG: AgmX/PglI C-terminal domain-containing protein [Pseudomonadota bacterium]